VQVSVFAVLILVLIVQRIYELMLAERNRRWSRARGGKELGARHYRVIVAVHALFYLSLVLEWRYWSHGWNPAWPLWLALVLGSQVVRLWAIRTLGRAWNTRIIVIPGMTPVERGPYRFIRHPNYLVLIIEMFAIPVLCGDYVTAIAFSAAKGMTLARRIPEEERAMEQAHGAPLRRLPRFFPRRQTDLAPAARDSGTQEL
jgi:methyltransferase